MNIRKQEFNLAGSRRSIRITRPIMLIGVVHIYDGSLAV